MVYSSRKNEEITLTQSTSDPSFVLIADLPLAFSFQEGRYIKVAFAVKDIANFLVNVEMFVVEVFDHRGILVSEFLG